MSDFGAQVRSWTEKATVKSREVFVAVAQHAHRSLQTGSETTGSPGQPVLSGNLRASWHLTFETPNSALISTNVVYAPPIEDGIGPHGPMTLRSAVGGFHSLALTRMGFQRIVDEEAAKVRA